MAALDLGTGVAATQLSHSPEPSGHAVCGEADGLDIGGQHGQQFFLCVTLTGGSGYHTRFVQAGVETSGTGAEVVKPDPGFSWEGHSRRVGGGVRDESTESCGVVTPLSIGDLPSAARILLSSDKLICNCAASTNRCLDLRCHAFALYGHVSAEWRRHPGSIAQRARDSVAPLQ